MTPVDLLQQMDKDGNVTTIIHLTVPQGDRWIIACAPEMEELYQTMHHPVRLRTDDARAVTCPACKRTDEYKEARGRAQ